MVVRTTTSRVSMDTICAVVMARTVLVLIPVNWLSVKATIWSVVRAETCAVSSPFTWDTPSEDTCDEVSTEILLEAIACKLAVVKTEISSVFTATNCALVKE